MNERSLIPFARDISLKAHGEAMVSTAAGFRRPQILHLQEVADLVWISGGTNDEIAAAWLHDILEDTPITKNDIVEKFGNNIAEIVQGLTDLEEFTSLPLIERKQKQAARLKNEGQSVRRIKISDQISNIRALMDPTNDMTIAQWEDYLEGSRLIAHECRGISPLLDALFLKTYEEGREILKKRQEIFPSSESLRETLTALS